MTDGPTVNLLVVLIQIFVAIGVGHVAVRTRSIVPGKGDLNGWQFFVGKVCLPLLIFRLVATSQVGKIDFRAIVACTLGKVSVFALTWIGTYVTFGRDRDSGQRFLTATVFGYFASATNDFVFGMPVIGALDPELLVYLGANAAVNALTIQPIALVLFELGKSAQLPLAGREESGGGKRCLSLVKQILLNPIIFMTLGGLAYQLLFFWTLVEQDGTRQFPRPLSDILQLLVSPFQMMALFLTGASLSSFKLNFWVSILVLMKGLVCAYISFFICRQLVAVSPETARLTDFAFFYGSIPASSAPLVFAVQFDREAAPTIASAIFWGYVLAAPNLFVSSVFILESADQTALVRSVIQILAWVSCAASGLVVGFMAYTCKQWSFAMRLLGIYGLLAFLYACSTIFLLQASQPCASGLARYIFTYWQNCLYLVVYYLQFLFARRWLGGRYLVIGILALFAVAPTWYYTPFTLNVICREPPPEDISNLQVRASLDFVWTLGLSAICLRLWSLPGRDPDPAMHPTVVIPMLCLLQAIKCIVRFVNSYAESLGNPNVGGFVEMLIVENILEHGQGIILVLGLAFEDCFLKQVERLQEAVNLLRVVRLPSRRSLVSVEAVDSEASQPQAAAPRVSGRRSLGGLLGGLRTYGSAPNLAELDQAPLTFTREVGGPQPQSVDQR